MKWIIKGVRNLIILSLLPVCLLSQEEQTGNWIMYFGANKISQSFSIHTEVQYRNHTFVPNNIEQLLLRTGLNYHISESAMATAGYGFIPSYTYESEQNAPETKEHRIWQQFILTNRIGRVKFAHRYRMEQRWVEKVFKYRYRYRIMVSVPLNKTEIEKGSLFLAFYDEIFVNSKNTYFDRNRIYGALGYQYKSNANVQIGMLHQQLNEFGKWYFQFAMIYNPDFSKKRNK